MISWVEPKEFAEERAKIVRPVLWWRVVYSIFIALVVPSVLYGASLLLNDEPSIGILFVTGLFVGGINFWNYTRLKVVQQSINIDNIKNEVVVVGDTENEYKVKFSSIRGYSINILDNQPILSIYPIDGGAYNVALPKSFREIEMNIHDYFHGIMHVCFVDELATVQNT
ncbi:hypothetical protein [Photobacterium chitinilyticum]|uniref:Uncharacterized protein n=1 Tax=Photobacterium chitinilyticum TaxID=2485123 RepID=A0A444JI34_9GAMM|nr:hypothetical protein [Photobacterium chitinilyticum]RWX52667.1 hypothetical protein EDI28_26270 [Photobacterium chitinilyticum]